MLDALAIPMVSAAGFEADDVIATLAAEAVDEGMDVLVVTGDRDALQLVGDQVTVLMTRRGISDMTRFTPAEVQDRYGLVPAAVPGLRRHPRRPERQPPEHPRRGGEDGRQVDPAVRLAGRAGRPGRRGQGKAGEALREHLAEVVRNRQLTELARDVALEVGPRRPAVGQWDREQVHQLFDTLQFRVLRDRLYQTLSAVEPEADRLRGAGRVLRARARSRSGSPSTRRRRPGGCPSRHLGARHRCGHRPRAGLGTGRAVCRPDAAHRRRRDGTGGWLADPARARPCTTRRARCSRWPSGAGRSPGWSATPRWPPTWPCPGSAPSTWPTWRCATCAGSCGPRFPPTASCRWTARTSPTRPKRPWSGPGLCVDLADALERSSSGGGDPLLRDVELPLTGVLARMERTGIAADADHLADLESHFGAQVAEGDRGGVRLGRARVQPRARRNSCSMCCSTSWSCRRRSGSRPATPPTRTRWPGSPRQTEHPLIGHLLRHRDVARLKTVVDSLIPMVDDSGRVHTTYNQIIAATGRLSSQDPNLQNIPIRTAEGRQIRRAFVVGRPGGTSAS